MNNSLTTVRELVSAGALEFGDGYRTKRSEHGQNGFRIIRVADVMNDSIKFDGPDFVSKEFAKVIGGKAGRPGDILLTTKGTVGRVAVMPHSNETTVYSPQLCYFRVIDDQVLHPRYLRYWFGGREFWEQASFLMNNTDMAAYINMADIRSLKLSLPSICQQQAIAEVLGALDDKIASNVRIASAADEWVRAEYDLLAGLSDEQRSVAEIVINSRNTADPELLEVHVPYVGLEHIPRRSLWLEGHGSSDEVTSNKNLFKSGDILFGKLRPYFHKIVTAPKSGICSTDVLVLTPIDEALSGFALASLAHDSVVQAVTAASEGTRMPRTSWKDLSTIDVPWPGQDAAEDFSTKVSAIREHVIALLAENQTLAATRDALLPQLMSGKLCVKDAEALVEPVV